jgi:Cytochrome c oxidase subunit IV
VAEELRFFLRSAIWVIGSAIVYWLVSSEPAGTVLLVALGLAIVAFIAVVGYEVRSSVDDLRPGGGALGLLNRVIGFHESPREAPPLAAEPGRIPLASIWPIVAATAAVTIGLGLLYGAWLALPGIALGAVAVYGWIIQLD